MNLGFEQFEQFGAPSILTRATDDINQLERMAVVVLRPLVRAPLMFLGATYMALTTDVKLSGIILISAPMLLAVVVFIAKNPFPVLCAQGNLWIKSAYASGNGLRGFASFAPSKKKATKTITSAILMTTCTR